MMSWQIKRRALIIISAIFIVLLAPTVSADSIYVAPHGSDQNTGTQASPLGSIQSALDKAIPGDTVLVFSGTYRENLKTRRAGSAQQPIRIQRYGSGAVEVTAAKGVLLTVSHPNFSVSALLFDGQFNGSDVIRVFPTADNFHFENNVVRNGSRDGMDLGSVATTISNKFDFLENVRIENCKFENFLATRPIIGRIDAHGIVAGGVRNLRINKTSISMVSGDSLQLANGAWDRVFLDQVKFFNGPLDSETAAASGFEVNVNPGENAIDTKQDVRLPQRGRLVIKRSEFYGWKGDLITNSAALNLKEKVDVVIQGCKFFDNDIALRLRGSRQSDLGAHVSASNNIFYENERALRVEDNLREFRLINNTFAGGGLLEFVAGGAAKDFVAANNLFSLAAIPAELKQRLNIRISQDDFLSPKNNDYRLLNSSPAVDSAMKLLEVPDDFDGVLRPQGEGYDFGAFELREEFLR